MSARSPLVSSLVCLLALAAPVALAAPAMASSTTNEIVYVDEGGGERILPSTVILRDLETRGGTVVLPRDSQDNSRDSSPELSPDGARIVLTTSRGGAGSGVAVVGRDGSGLRRLTAPEDAPGRTVTDAGPTWAPDGVSVLFERSVFTSSGSNNRIKRTSSLFTVPGGRQRGPDAGAGHRRCGRA